MLKKCGVTVIILLIMASFVIGPVNAVGEQAALSETIPADAFAFYGTSLPYFNGIFPAGHAHSAQKYTTVILDLSDRADKNPMYTGKSGAAYAGFSPGQMPPWPFFANKGDFIGGSIIVQMAGNDTPQVFPVQFKHTPSDKPGMPSFDLYKAMLAFKMSHDEEGMPAGLVMYSPDGPDPLNGSEDAYLTFSGEISVAGPILANGTPEDTYINEVVNGQTIWHQAQVSGTSLNVDLKWQNAGDDLRLTIYTPDGHVLGPYNDAADGKSDGRVNLEISDHGDVADGTWSFKVTGTDVAGKDEYYLRTW